MTDTGVIDLPELADLPVNDMGPLEHFYEHPRDRMIVEGEPAFCGLPSPETRPARRWYPGARMCAACVREHRARGGGGL